jgi:drug/metabolite transporter (DMT)-like permease
MTKPRALLLALAAIFVCSAVAFYRGKAFDPRRMVAIALCGAGVLFVAGFQPTISAAMSGLLMADVLVLNKNGQGVVAAVGKVAAPGASTTVSPAKSPAPS